MQAITTETNVYTIDELKADHPEAYEKAIEKNADINVDHDWFDWIREDASEQWDML